MPKVACHMRCLLSMAVQVFVASRPQCMPLGWHDLTTAEQEQPCPLSTHLQLRPKLFNSGLDLHLMLDVICTVWLCPDALCICAFMQLVW